MASERHLWIDAVPRPGWANMAIDQSLLDRVERTGELWLRLYGWAPHCLSFGRHEPAARRYDATRIAALGLDVVRRPTGGRAVWHARGLTYAFAGPSGTLGSLREAYLEIHRMLLDALRALGAPAALAPAPAGRSPGVDAGACFAGAVGGEIVVGGRKVVGSAQLRQGGALLQHGSILLEDDQSMVSRVTRGAAPPDQAAALAWVLGAMPPEGDLVEAIAESAAQTWGVGWGRRPPADEVEGAAARHAERFQSPAWTWGDCASPASEPS